MKLKTTIALFLLMAFSSFAYAGEGHSHGPAEKVSSSQVAIVAKNLVSKLAKDSKIDPSWGMVENEEALEQIKLQGEMVWRATYKNSKISDSSKTTLYAFVGESGQLLGISYDAVPVAN